MPASLNMKELPGLERPYEKCLHYGASYLSDAELMAVIFRTGTKGISCVDLACKILNFQNGGLLNLYHMSCEELKNITGIGDVKAIQMKCVAELSLRLAKATRVERIHLCDAASVASYYMEDLRHKEKETLLLSMFDAKCSLIADQVISIGTVNASLISGREIFLSALSHRAVHIILLHNHPSGSPTPSRQDILVTEKIKEIGDILGIQLSDHIIIGDNKYYSFKEKGLLT